jgi:hypothetical protein
MAGLPNAPNNLEIHDVGLEFWIEIFEFMDFINQNLKFGKD